MPKLDADRTDAPTPVGPVLPPSEPEESVVHAAFVTSRDAALNAGYSNDEFVAAIEGIAWRWMFPDQHRPARNERVEALVPLIEPILARCLGPTLVA